MEQLPREIQSHILSFLRYNKIKYVNFIGYFNRTTIRGYDLKRLILSYHFNMLTLS